MNTKEFIEKASTVHGNKYNYSKVDYINAKTKVCIVCPKHGEFFQIPDSHLRGSGCKKCGYESISNKNSKYTKEKIIELFHKVHGNKYDYSKVEYSHIHTKVCII